MQPERLRHRHAPRERELPRYAVANAERYLTSIAQSETELRRIFGSQWDRRKDQAHETAGRIWSRRGDNNVVEYGATHREAYEYGAVTEACIAYTLKQSLGADFDVIKTTEPDDQRNGIDFIIKSHKDEAVLFGIDATCGAKDFYEAKLKDVEFETSHTMLRQLEFYIANTRSSKASANRRSHLVPRFVVGLGTEHIRALSETIDYSSDEIAENTSSLAIMLLREIKMELHAACATAKKNGRDPSPYIRILKQLPPDADNSVFANAKRPDSIYDQILQWARKTMIPTGPEPVAA